ncbi:hypothetical protein EP47_07785 [Legionella norrlandica]|uniref:Uncharacterized protein n=1 Tax=Legionella norrlandica TaxID=1498499 RepID=A0A0A2SP70_9GAMM|nr:hypothetical protein [Legionella norrlandica]KGP62895.1 hypothetical protein EP47_07785 [Legionella norrlandica]
MADNILIDFTTMDEACKAQMQEYLNKFIVQLEQISDIIKYFNPQSTIRKEVITNLNNWAMRHVVPSTGRGSPEMSLRVPNRAKDTTASLSQSVAALFAKGTDNLFDYLKQEIDKARDKTSNKDKKKELQELKGYVDLLQVQAISKIAEVGALNYLSQLKGHFKEIYACSSRTKDADTQKIWHEVNLSVNELEKNFSKYSLDFLTTNNVLENFSYKDAGRVRVIVDSLYKDIKENIKTLNETGKCLKDYIEITKTLESAVGCFAHKNNISFQLPTAGATTRQKIRGLTSLSLGVVGMGSCIGSAVLTIVSVAAPPVASVTGPMAVGLGGISLVSGISASTMTILNGASNYFEYHLPFSLEEKITLTLVATSLLTAGANNLLGSTLPVVTTSNSVAKTLITAGLLGRGVHKIISQADMKKQIEKQGDGSNIPASDEIKYYTP